MDDLMLVDLFTAEQDDLGCSLWITCPVCYFVNKNFKEKS